MFQESQVLGEWSLSSVGGKSSYTPHTCLLVISVCAQPSQLGRYIHWTDWGAIQVKNTIFLPKLFFYHNLFLPLGLHGYINIYAGTFVTAMWRRVKEKGETNRRLLKPALLQKGKSHQTVVWGFTNLPWQHKPLLDLRSSHPPVTSSAVENCLWVKKHHPLFKLVALAQLEREEGSTGKGAYACRCGDRRAVVTASAAKGKVMLHWSHFPGCRSWKVNWLELAQSSHRKCKGGGVRRSYL